MDLGSVTLLELLHVPDGGRVGYCLPTGEFVLASSACAAELGAGSAAALYGKNVYPFLELADAERLEDYARAHYRNGAFLVDPASELRLLVRLARGAGRAGRPTMLWTRLVTIPLTLRLLRCVDALLCFNPQHAFADSSSLVATEDELSALFSHRADLGRGCCPDDCALADDLARLADCAPVVPLELQETARPAACADDEASLASYAFAADWADELDALQAPALVL